MTEQQIIVFTHLLRDQGFTEEQQGDIFEAYMIATDVV